MANQYDGGPASINMTIRDKFAESAMIAIMSGVFYREDHECFRPVCCDEDGRLLWNHEDNPKQLAKMAHQLADAMLEARKH